VVTSNWYECNPVENAEENDDADDASNNSYDPDNDNEAELADGHDIDSLELLPDDIPGVEGNIDVEEHDNVGVGGEADSDDEGIDPMLEDIVNNDNNDDNEDNNNVTDDDSNNESYLEDIDKEEDEDESTQDEQDNNNVNNIPKGLDGTC
jgi:hypothetical protein